MPKLKKKSIEQRSRADKERKQQIRGKSLHVVTLLYVYYLVWYTDLGGRGVFRRLTSLLFIFIMPWSGKLDIKNFVVSLPLMQSWDLNWGAILQNEGNTSGRPLMVSQIASCLWLLFGSCFLCLNDVNGGAKHFLSIFLVDILTIIGRVWIC